MVNRRLHSDSSSAVLKIRLKRSRHKRKTNQFYLCGVFDRNDNGRAFIWTNFPQIRKKTAPSNLSNNVLDISGIFRVWRLLIADGVSFVHRNINRRLVFNDFCSYCRDHASSTPRHNLYACVFLLVYRTDNSFTHFS